MKVSGLVTKTKMSSAVLNRIKKSFRFAITWGLVNDKFVIFEWTIPLSTKWNTFSNYAILSVSLVPIQLWGETGYISSLSWPVHQDFLDKGVQDLLWFESFCFHQFGNVPAILSLSHCPGPVTEPGRREWAHFVPTQQARPVPILLHKLSCITTLLWPKWELKSKNRAKEW